MTNATTITSPTALALLQSLPKWNRLNVGQDDAELLKLLPAQDHESYLGYLKAWSELAHYFETEARQYRRENGSGWTPWKVQAHNACQLRRVAKVWAQQQYVERVKSRTMAISA